MLKRTPPSRFKQAWQALSKKCLFADASLEMVSLAEDLIYRGSYGIEKKPWKAIREREREQEREKDQILPAHLSPWTESLITEINPYQITDSTAEHLNLSIRTQTEALINISRRALETHGHNEDRNTSAACGTSTALVLSEQPDDADHHPHHNIRNKEE